MPLWCVLCVVCCVLCVVCCVLCVVCVGLQNAGKCKIPPSISTGCTVTTRNDGPMVQHRTSTPYR
jgi:hypothetical protein